MKKNLEKIINGTTTVTTPQLINTSNKDTLLSNEVGSGTIQVLELEPGLKLWVFDCTLNNETNLPDLMHQENSRTFTLAYFLNTQGVIFTYENSVFQNNTILNTIFFSHDANLKASILPEKHLRCVAINLTPEWFSDNVAKTYFPDRMSSNFNSENPFVVFESFTSSEQQVLNELFQNTTSNHLGLITIRAGALNLSSDFFNKVKERQNLGLFTSYAYRGNAIAEIEKILTENICGTLPNLKELSGKFSMSESTLKRHFRRMYGTNIHAYFIEKKMAYARQLIEEKKVNVTDAAYVLGYQKVSHFISMFKKHYGLLPGKLKERKAV
jgi:AraC-like DNA-binding protein